MIKNCEKVDVLNPNMDNILKKIGDYMFEKLKEDFKVIDLEKERIAKQVNKMMLSGETDSIRQTPTGTVIGSYETTERLKALKEKLNKINGRVYGEND